MDFMTFTWLIDIQLRGLELAARELESFDELVCELTPLLMVCDSDDGYFHAPEYPRQRFEGEEIVIVGADPRPTYFFETMTFARAQKYSPDMDVLVFMAPVHTTIDLLPRYAGDDTIRLGRSRDVDWRDEKRHHGLPPRKLGREDYRSQNHRRPPSGLRGR